MAQELVRLGAEVDLLGSDGMTPLHYACRSTCFKKEDENKCHNFRYGRNITERFGGDVMSGRTDYGEEDPGLDTVRVLVEEKKASVTKVK